MRPPARSCPMPNGSAGINDRKFRPCHICGNRRFVKELSHTYRVIACYVAATYKDVNQTPHGLRGRLPSALPSTTSPSSKPEQFEKAYNEMKKFAAKSRNWRSGRSSAIDSDPHTGQQPLGKPRTGSVKESEKVPTSSESGRPLRN